MAKAIMLQGTSSHVVVKALLPQRYAGFFIKQVSKLFRLRRKIWP